MPRLHAFATWTTSIMASVVAGTVEDIVAEQKRTMAVQTPPNVSDWLSLCMRYEYGSHMSFGASDSGHCRPVASRQLVAGDGPAPAPPSTLTLVLGASVCVSTHI